MNIFSVFLIPVPVAAQRPGALCPTGKMEIRGKFDEIVIIKEFWEHFSKM